MSQQEDRGPLRRAALDPEELAAEGAAELPDREAMSLITGPGGAGPLPVIGPPFGVLPPGDTLGDPVAEPLADAPEA